MNMFNQINCRNVDEKDINVFRTLGNNFIFWIVIIGEVAVTVIMLLAGSTSFGNKVLGMTELNIIEISVAVVFGMLSLLVMVITKIAIPSKPFEKVIESLDLE